MDPDTSKQLETILSKKAQVLTRLVALLLTYQFKEEFEDFKNKLSSRFGIRSQRMDGNFILKLKKEQGIIGERLSFHLSNLSKRYLPPCDPC
jgi:hypothetical protein